MKVILSLDKPHIRFNIPYSGWEGPHEKTKEKIPTLDLNMKSDKGYGKHMYTLTHAHI